MTITVPKQHILSTHLHNQYFVLRHGESEANELEVIVSDPRDGTKGYGLTPEGKKQVIKSVLEARNSGILDAPTIICSSDFTRTREAAEIARDVLGCTKVNLTPRLRERCFGELEKTHDSNYTKVWADDEINPDHKNHGVESSKEVLARMLSVIDTLEKEHKGVKILLVSHGDPIRLLKTAFIGEPFAPPSRVPHMDNAAIEELGEMRVMK